MTTATVQRRMPIAAGAWTALALAAVLAQPGPTSAADEALAPAPQTATSEPQFEPGIPGLTMKDVREYRLLWRELRVIEEQERDGHLETGAYRGRVLELTSRYLELEGTDAARFTAAAADAVRAVEKAYRRSRAPEERATPPADARLNDPDRAFDPRWALAHRRLTDDMQTAEGLVTAALASRPRHRLFAADSGKWLRRLAIGTRRVVDTRG